MRSNSTALLFASFLVACMVAAAPAGGVAAADRAAAARPTIRINVYPGGSASWLTHLAQAGGFFKRNGIQVDVNPIANGPEVANAFLSGSLDVAILDPTVVIPLLSRGMKLKMVFADSSTFFSLIGSKGQSRLWPRGVQALKGKSVAVLALGSANYNLLRVVLRAGGLSDTDVSYVSTGSVPGNVAAMLQGRVNAVMVELLGYCELRSRGYPSLWSFVDPKTNPKGAPSSLARLATTPENTYWVKTSWAASHRDALRRYQLAMLEAGQWASKAKNLRAVTGSLRASVFNLPDLSAARWTSCVKTGVAAYRLSFSTADAARWTAVLNGLGVPASAPPARTWIDSGVPASRKAVARTITRLKKLVHRK